MVVIGLTQIHGRSQGLTVNLLNLPLTAFPSDRHWGSSFAKFILLTTLNGWYNQNRGMLRLTSILGFALNSHPQTASSTSLTLPWRSLSKAPPHPHRQMGCFAHVGLLLHPAPVTHLPQAKLNISFNIQQGLRRREREKNENRSGAFSHPLQSVHSHFLLHSQITLGTFSDTKTHNIKARPDLLKRYFLILH